MLWSYSKLFFSWGKYTISITLNVPTDIPNIYFNCIMWNEPLFVFDKNKNDRFNLTGKYTGSFLFCKIQVLNTSLFLYSLSIYAQKNTVHIWIHADGHMHILRENILWLQTWNQKMIASWQESDDKLRQCFEKQRHYSADEGLYSQGHRGLPSGHIWL